VALKRGHDDVGNWKEAFGKNQIGMRCRATREIRTHEGLIRRFTEGTIQAVIDNLGRQLISVRWDNGITAYVFLNEIEITDSVELSAAFF
jgi:hypothetical protein